MTDRSSAGRHGGRRWLAALLAVLALVAGLAAPVAAEEHENGNGNGNGNGEEPPPPDPEPEPDPDAIEARRLDGEDRYATAAEVARDAFEAPVAHAVLARGDDFPDALAGSYLAGHLRAPVLLTPSTALAEAASSVLAELQVGTVHLLGGPSAISPAVADELTQAGYQVRRVAGGDRYATAAAIADAAPPGRVARLDGQRTALLASGINFPDSLAAGPLAYRAGLPLLLTHPSALVPATEEALTALAIEQVLVLGGPAAISPDVLAALGQRGISTRRLAGPTRVETALAVAEMALAELAWDATAVRLARADAFPDGLSGSPHAGEGFAPVVLTPTQALHPAAERWLQRHAGVVEDLAVFGGVAALSDGTVAAAALAAGTRGPNQAYEVTPDAVLRSFGAARTCTVHTPLDGRVNLRLLPAANVVTGDDGVVRFKDIGPTDGRADVDPVASATIRAVGGQSQPDGTTTVDGVAVADGELRVAIAADALDHVVLLAFTDRIGGTAGALDLTGPVLGTPLEPFGVGCETRWFPGEATHGTHQNLIVQRVDPGGAVVAAASAGQPATFLFDDDDEFEVAGAPTTLGGFAAAASKGDALRVDYGTAPDGSSVFEITTDTVQATPKPYAEVVGSGVLVTFVPPGDNGTGTTYRVRRRSGPVLEDGACGNMRNEVSIGEVAAPPFVDTTAEGGCYDYRVWARSSTGAEVQSANFSDPVVFPAPAAEEGERPRSQAAVVTVDRTPQGALTGGDVIGITFDLPLARPRPGASITVRDDTGATAVITHGADALFVRDEPGTTLTITLFRDPPAVPAIPADIAAQSGITGEQGEPWDVATSPDRRLESGTAPPEEDPPDEEEEEE